MHILRCTHGTEYEVRVHCSLYLSHSKSIITWSNVVNIHQFQIAIQLPQLRTWTHPFLWDVLRCGRPPSRAKHAKFTSSILYVWLCMEKFYEQLVTRVIKMIIIKEFSGHSCQCLSYCAAHVSPKLRFVWCLPRLRNPNIDQLCTQKLAYYIPASFKLTRIMFIYI